MNPRASAIEERLNEPAIFPLYTLQQYNVVTDFFAADPGWEINDNAIGSEFFPPTP